MPKRANDQAPPSIPEMPEHKTSLMLLTSSHINGPQAKSHVINQQ
jgi:hypothetical protein